MVEVQQNKGEGHQNGNNYELEDWDKKPLLDRDVFLTEFDTHAYLKDFYTNLDDPAMQMIVKFLPGIVVRLRKTESLLDFGCGPTIHVSVCFRNHVQRIYLADYLPQNREELQRWLGDRSDFDWSETLRKIATSEGTDWSKIKQMEDDARAKIAGIFHCDCLSDNVLEADRKYNSFGVVVTIFTLEYCCNTLNEYRDAIRRVVSLVKEGGHFIMGGILEETWCSFGGRKFNCLYITKEFMLECLEKAGLIIDFDNKSTITTIMHEVNGMFLICAQKGTRLAN